MSHPRPVTPVRAGAVTHCAAETDVLIVGFGCAGAAAAFEAASAGAGVLVLERAGGSSALSGGELYLGGGTEVQRACGFEDSPEEKGGIHGEGYVSGTSLGDGTFFGRRAGTAAAAGAAS